MGSPSERLLLDAEDMRRELVGECGASAPGEGWPPGRTGPDFEGREKEAEREDEEDEEEGRRALRAVLAARDGDGRLWVSGRQGVGLKGHDGTKEVPDSPVASGTVRRGRGGVVAEIKLGDRWVGE